MLTQQVEQVWPGETCWEKAVRIQGWHERSLLLQLCLVRAYIDDVHLASPGSAPNYHKLLEMQPYSARNRLPRPSYWQTWYFTKAEKDPNQLCIIPFYKSVEVPIYFSFMVNSFCRFIPNSTNITYSLGDLLKCNTKCFTEMPEAEASYITAKQHLSNPTKLRHLDTSSRTQMVL